MSTEPETQEPSAAPRVQLNPTVDLEQHKPIPALTPEPQPISGVPGPEEPSEPPDNGRLPTRGMA